MSEKKFFIFLILILLCKCETNNDDLIKNYPYLIAIFIFILITSFILSLLIIFIPDKEKHERNTDIRIANNSVSDKTENTNDKSNMETTNLIKDSNNNKDENNKLFNRTFIGRILFTILSLEPLFFIYNFIVQDIFIFPGILYDMENKYLKYFFYLIYIFFIYFSSKLLIFPTYEFLNFPFLRYNNPFCHLNSFRCLIYNNKEYNEISDLKGNNKFNNTINISIICVEVVFCLLFIIGIKFKTARIIKDFMEIVILIIIFINYLTISFCYFIFSFYYIYKVLKNKFSFDHFKNNKYSKLNLLYYIVNPFIDDNYEDQSDNTKKTVEDRFYKARLIILIAMIPICFIASIKYYQYFNWQFLILNWILLLSSFLSFPFCCSNKKISKKGKYLKETENLQLLISRTVSFAIFIFSLGFFLYVNSLDDFDDNESIYNDIINITNKNLKTKNEYYRNFTMHSFCYSGIHNIPIYLYIPFINDAYYYQNKTRTTLNKKKYINLFYDDDYKIEIIGNLINNSKRMSKMIQYNVYNKRNNITILSIKGTSFRRDIYLDIQLYFPAILLNIINTYSTLDQQKEEWAFKFIEYGLSIPYRIFFDNFIIKNYLDDLRNAYDDNYNKTKFLDNIIFVGHSLGGGLAKILGRLKGKEALSLSGPGMNSFHSLFNYEGNSEYFELTSVDIIPDLDLVPRVDISGGTVHRILCLNSTYYCHSKELSLCESMIMCRHPNAREYCYNITKLGTEGIEKLYNATDYNKNN